MEIKNGVEPCAMQVAIYNVTIQHMLAPVGIRIRGTASVTLLLPRTVALDGLAVIQEKQKDQVFHLVIKQAVV